MIYFANAEANKVASAVSNTVVNTVTESAVPTAASEGVATASADGASVASTSIVSPHSGAMNLTTIAGLVVVMFVAAGGATLALRKVLKK